MKNLVKQIVAIVEANLKDRRGLSWDNLEDEKSIQELRDSIVNDILIFLKKEDLDEESR